MKMVFEVKRDLSPCTTLIYVVISCILYQSKTLAQQCGYTSIHVTSDDGSHQIFTVKAVDTTEHTQKSSCNDCQTGINRGGSGALYAHSNAIEYPGNHVDPNQSTSLVFGEILDECENSLPMDLCRAAQGVTGHCSELDSVDVTHDDLKEYSALLVQKKLLPMASGQTDIDIKLAYGGLLAALNRIDEAIIHFDSLTEIYSDEAALYFMKGMTNMHQGLEKLNLNEAAWNFRQCTMLDRNKWECYEKAAEAYYGLGQYELALEQVAAAISIHPTARLFFTHANILFYIGDMIGAEKSFERCADLGDFNKMDAIYNLGLVRFHRGKIRESIGAFRDAIKLKKDHLQAHVSLAHAYKELGNYPQAVRSINNALSLDSSDVKALQVQGMLYYYSGQPHLALQSYKNCLKEEERNQACLYMLGLCHISMGHFYEAIKAETKAIVYSNHPALKVSSEYIKAHYLREYSRYLHRKLNDKLTDLNLDEDLCSYLKDGWLKNIPFDIQGVCAEQPGVQPDVEDVHVQELNISGSVQELLCFAKNIGTAAQVNCDGYLANKRQNLALGLAAIHVAQHLEEALRNIKNKNNKNVVLPEWKELYGIATQYFRLVDPEIPIFWFEQMPEEILLNSGFKTDLPFIEGHVINIRAKSYFDLVFRLVKSMIDNYNSDGVISTEVFRSDLKMAESEDDLIGVVRKNQLRDQGFVISTQVPSVRDVDSSRHEGVMILLSGGQDGKVDFVINHVTTKQRSEAYSDELSFLLRELYAHVRRRKGRLEVESVLSTLLSIAYYLYNLMPLTRGSSLVTYSLLVGLVMALGGRIQGKVPPGKLLDMEAILSGAPDAFIMVTQQWLDIHKSNISVSDYARVQEVFPTVRSVLEVLNTGVTEC